MRIHVVNPNTTRSMTLKIGAAAKAAASPDVEVSAANPEFGPPSIEGYFDEAFSIPGLIEEIGKAASRRRLRHRLLRRHRARGGALRVRRSRSSASAKPRSTWRASSRRNSASSRRCRARSRRSSIIWRDTGLRPLRAGARRRRAGARARRAGLGRAAHHRRGDRARARRGRRRGDRARLRRHDRSRPRSREGGRRPRCSTASPARSASPRAWSGIGLKTSKRNTYAPPLAKPYAGEFERFSPKNG